VAVHLWVQPPSHLLQTTVKDYAFKINVLVGDLERGVSYGPPWAHCLGGYQDQLLGGPLGLLGLCHTAPDGVGQKDYGGEVLG
jgi:hypothetical protein